MKNLKDAETRVTVGDSRTITTTKFGNWHGYQKIGGKLHRLTLSNTSAISDMHENLFSVMQELQKCSQEAPEG